jgi:hypothetical protein
LPLDRGAHAGDERRADRDPHRSAHESEILDRDYGLVAIDIAAGVEQGVALAGRGPRGFQPVGVALAVLEAQRILADLRRGAKICSKRFFGPMRSWKSQRGQTL